MITASVFARRTYPGEVIDRIDFTRTNAKDVIWKLAKSGGYFWYMENLAVKFSSVDDVQATLEFDFETSGRTIANSSGITAMARSNNLILLAGNSGSTVNYIFGSFTYSGSTKTLNWGTRRTITVSGISSSNTVVDIAIDSKRNTAYILSSGGTIYTVSISGDTYTSATLQTPVGTINPPDKINATSVYADGENIVVSYKGVASSAPSGNFTLNTNNGDVLASVVIEDTLFACQRGSRTVYAYIKDTGVAKPSLNQTLAENNLNPTGVSAVRYFFPDSNQLEYDIYVADSLDKRVYGYKYYPNEPSASWEEDATPEILQPFNNLSIETENTEYWGEIGFTDGTYLYVGAANEGSVTGTFHAL